MAVAMVGARAPPPSCPPGLCCSPHPPLPPSDAIPASFRAPAGLGICRLSGGASHPHGLALATVTVSFAGPVKANGPSHHTHTRTRPDTLLARFLLGELSSGPWAPLARTQRRRGLRVARARPGRVRVSVRARRPRLAKKLRGTRRRRGE